MTFFHNDGWVVQFMEPDLKTPVGQIRTFGDVDKVRQLIDRTPTSMNLEARNMLEHAISIGRGGMYLELTGEQYRKLKGGPLKVRIFARGWSEAALGPKVSRSDMTLMCCMF